MKKSTKKAFLPDSMFGGYIESITTGTDTELAICTRGEYVNSWWFPVDRSKRGLDRSYRECLKGIETVEKFLQLHRTAVSALYNEAVDRLNNKDPDEFDVEKWKLENL